MIVGIGLDVVKVAKVRELLDTLILEG